MGRDVETNHECMNDTSVSKLRLYSKVNPNVAKCRIRWPNGGP